MRALSAAWLLAVLAAPAAAQAPDTSLRVVVADQSGAIIVNATVRLQPTEPAGEARDALTNAQGEATFPGVTPGRYAIRAEFPGFDPRQIEDVRVRAGSSVRREMKLSIARVAQDVQVGQDPRDRALDARGNAFGNVLTREQIEALPDDPDEMEETLKQMAGPGATVRVDGFRGGRLPPKSQIQSIRFRRDLFAAENHGGGMIHVDIATRPGGGPLRGTVDFTFRDESLNARNAFAPSRAAEQQQNGTLTMSGSLIKDRTGFSFSTNGVNSYDSKTLNAKTPDQIDHRQRAPAGRSRQLQRPHRPRADQVARAARELRAQRHQQREPRRRRLRSARTRLFPRYDAGCLPRVGLGPVGKRFFNETRFQTRHQTSVSHSLTDAPALVVLEAFSSGGAQIAGGRNGTDVEFASDVDFATGRHAARAGVLFEGGRYRSDELRNAGGTFTFASPEDFTAGRPTTYTRRDGDPLVQYRARAVRVVRAGRYQDGEEPVAEPRPASRSPDPRERLSQLRAALRHDVVAVQVGIAHLPRRRRRVLRLVRSADLRADAARRRHASGRSRGAESRLSGSVRRRQCGRASVEPLSAVGRLETADDSANQRRRRTRRRQDGAAQPGLQLPARHASCCAGAT